MNIDNLELYMELINLERLLRAENAKVARLYGPLSDISHGQGRILAYLKLNEPVSIKELAKELNIRPQSLQDHLRHMENDGLIRRNRSETDSRVKLVSLTPQAREIEQNQRSYEELFKGLSEEELENLFQCIKVIEDNILEELGENHLEELSPGPPHHRKPVDKPPKPHHLRPDGELRSLFGGPEEIKPPAPHHPPLKDRGPHRPFEDRVPGFSKHLHRRPVSPDVKREPEFRLEPEIDFKSKPERIPPDAFEKLYEPDFNGDRYSDLNHLIDEFQNNFAYLIELIQQTQFIESNEMVPDNGLDIDEFETDQNEITIEETNEESSQNTEE